MQRGYEFLAERFEPAKSAGDAAVPVKMWTRGVPVDDRSQQQLLKAAQMPFIFRWLAVMPDVHHGIGSTIGSEIGRAHV